MPFRPMIKTASHRFIRAREGAAAVEFSLIAAPFFLLIFATLEVALFFLGSTIIENGVNEAARSIRTGQLQQSSQSVEDFRSSICERISSIADCSRIQLDVRTFESFSESTSMDYPLDENGDIDNSDFTFDPGGGGDVVVVRVFYDWQLLAPGVVSGMTNMSGNKRLITATSVFRNEPFE
ncbi:TadE/TadG family type IV pilus assembly protein [Oceanicaulis sp. MMSF_3324]|uniref:TadE/TadG family type IV pilus assembly protein n=1 Tax=Oceanicaulis sp. MMSF_3324 TaxID=3046702 RepID=UPI00273D0DF9|nr:TadE/TadG family type IV pilus assembly protein [Oceanicaulis sp. MMSF_3324]